MKKTLTSCLLLLAALPALATGSHNPPTRPAQPITIDVDAGAGASSSSGAQAGASSNAAGGSVSAPDYSRQNFYVLPAPVSAAPLPANLCPKGDSLSWSIGWNFFSYAKSSTRTELECLEKMLALIKAMQPPPAPKPVLLDIPPVVLPPTPASAASSSPKKKASTVKKAPPAVDCETDPKVLACRPKKST